MSNLMKKIIVFAALDSLILQPVPNRNQNPAPVIKIDYKTNAIQQVSKANSSIDTELGSGLECHGIVGIFTFSSTAYLVAILRRLQVAHILGRPVYAITDVAIVPISNQESAKRAIEKVQEEKRARDGRDYDETASDASEVSDTAALAYGDDVHSHHYEQGNDQQKIQKLEDVPAKRERRNSAIIEDVIGRKGAYGRFTENWFSSRGWTTGQRRNLGMSSQHNTIDPDLQLSPSYGSAATARSKPAELEQTDYRSWPQTPGTEKTLDQSLVSPSAALTNSLLSKMLQTTRLLFSSGTFFFSYEHDITQAMGRKIPLTSNDVPLYKQVKTEYFWNESLCWPLIQNGCDDFVLPIMQGFVGQRSFHVASSMKQNGGNGGNHGEEFLMTLISRRSKYRSGLRYLRRGIDENGYTANSVETEQILSSSRSDKSIPIQSFLQVRGSIPLFFSQMPYTFKPIPVLHASQETNQKALSKHLNRLASRYGPLQVVSLIDRHGGEVKIGDAYERQIRELNTRGGIAGKDIAFEWFDFHTVCKGMKFENVSLLVDSMSDFLSASSWTSSSTIGTVQSGIIRTNCMDCLDRTNVVQSAFAQYILERQLSTIGYPISLSSDTSTRWFNTLWADNGDAISRAYAGTAALKGDYTRTRQRNLSGALTDFSLTLSRYYHNLFNDFFAQAAIDYLLGVVTDAVFLEFETKMTTADPAIDLTKARESAIESASHVVVEGDEDLLHGWAMAAPANANASLRALPFEEVILLLTECALYVVRFDWDAEKVQSFERVALAGVTSLQRGAYITETLAASQMDETKNAGLLVRYGVNGEPGVVRVNTRALENIRDTWPSVDAEDGNGKEEASSQDPSGHERAQIDRVFAFKALPPRSSTVRAEEHVPVTLNEAEVVKSICAEIEEAINARPKSKGPRKQLTVEQKDIVSLSEAKRSTNILDHIGYSLKKFVWG